MSPEYTLGRSHQHHEVDKMGRRSELVHYVGLWTRWSWEVSDRTNHRRDVRAGNDFACELLFLKERSLTQQRQLTYCYPCLPNYPQHPTRSRGHSWCYRTRPTHLLQVFRGPNGNPHRDTAEAGFFKNLSSRRLVIIDGLDECSDPKVQQNIL